VNEISIIICTQNRSDQLRHLIHVFDREIIIPEDLTLQILVVDNHSEDATGAMVKRAIDCPRRYELTYTLEKRNGLSHARNRGVAEAKYARLAFLDDDALPDRLYLQSLNDCFTKYPTVLCFTHRVITVHRSKPDWYNTDGKYAMLDRGHYELGDTSRFLSPNDPLPIGSAMVISKEVFQRCGKFDPFFGYDSARSLLIPGEETEFFRKVVRRRISIYYVHSAVVHHYPDQSKYSFENLYKTYAGIGFWYGLDDARHQTQRRLRIWLGYPRPYFRRLITAFLKYLLSRLSLRTSARYYYTFQLKKIVSQFKGFQAHLSQNGRHMPADYENIT
jgi:GT2 family glycosyltransferase